MQRWLMVTRIKNIHFKSFCRWKGHRCWAIGISLTNSRSIHHVRRVRISWIHCMKWYIIEQIFMQNSCIIIYFIALFGRSFLHSEKVIMHSSLVKKIKEGRVQIWANQLKKDIVTLLDDTKNRTKLQGESYIYTQSAICQILHIPGPKL